MDKSIRNLMFDRSLGREIYDAETERVVSAVEADEAIRKYVFEELGLTKDSTPREIKRALKSEKGVKLFQIIEEISDKLIATGWKDNEFFNAFVEDRNLADGDMNEFWVEGQDIILNVARVSGSHHDLHFLSPCSASCM